MVAAVVAGLALLGLAVWLLGPSLKTFFGPDFEPTFKDEASVERHSSPDRPLAPVPAAVACRFPESEREDQRTRSVRTSSSAAVRSTDLLGPPRAWGRHDGPGRPSASARLERAATLCRC